MALLDACLRYACLYGDSSTITSSTPDCLHRVRRLFHQTVSTQPEYVIFASHVIYMFQPLKSMRSVPPLLAVSIEVQNKGVKRIGIILGSDHARKAANLSSEKFDFRGFSKWNDCRALGQVHGPPVCSILNIFGGGVKLISCGLSTPFVWSRSIRPSIDIFALTDGISLRHVNSYSVVLRSSHVAQYVR